ncbi:hypothetical protein [Paenibacillus ginsengarvi]|uniref:Uncharacterized protein n=1 Tax=Paenibacillus ginsengarvi TaxID=400777 RepID=A0A3B0CMS4_9BACL|nr:hypothetical protein [Paenibacillus ginsengarvi]RKN85569.1 hypothetical protein D7M11_07745 [Paenibacillus ginsengarvi]
MGGQKQANLVFPGANRTLIGGLHADLVVQNKQLADEVLRIVDPFYPYRVVAGWAVYVAD